MIQVPEQALKNLLTVIDDVGWWLHYKAEDDEEARQLLERLKDAKDKLEEQAQEVKPP